jgi:hypothetical protein
MPSYYFHIRENGELIKDPDGIELPDIDAVQDEVTNSIIAVLEDEQRDELLADREFQVEDQDGRTVLTVPFRLAVPLGTVLSRKSMAKRL